MYYYIIRNQQNRIVGYLSSDIPKSIPHSEQVDKAKFVSLGGIVTKRQKPNETPINPQEPSITWEELANAIKEGVNGV